MHSHGATVGDNGFGDGEEGCNNAVRWASTIFELQDVVLDAMILERCRVVLNLIELNHRRYLVVVRKYICVSTWADVAAAVLAILKGVSAQIFRAFECYE